MAHVTVAKRIFLVYVAVILVVVASSAGLARQQAGAPPDAAGRAGRGGRGAGVGGAGGAGPVNAFAYADCNAANATALSLVIVTGAVPAAVPASTPQPSIKLMLNTTVDTLTAEAKTIEFSPDAAKGGPLALALSCPVVGDCVPARSGTLTIQRAADGAISGSYQAAWPPTPARMGRFNAVWRESQKKCG